MNKFLNKANKYLVEARDYVDDKFEKVTLPSSQRGRGEEPSEWEQRNLDREDSIALAPPPHVEEGLVPDQDWNDWHHNQRVLMGHTAASSYDEVMMHMVHSSKFLTKWEAKTKRFAMNNVASVLAADQASLDLSPCDFGHEMRRRHFNHLSGQFMNSASYGCTPDVVFKARQFLEEKMHSNNVMWRFRTVPLRVREAEYALANVIKADPDDLTFVPNANYGSNAVLKSQPWEPGDILLVFSCDYEATLFTCRWLRWKERIEVITIDMPLPATDEEILKRVRLQLEALLQEGRMAKLANFCHVTSKTAWIFPAKKLVDLFHKYGVSVLVDGAQAAGHIDINVGDINADYYVGTMHKWMYTCPGVAFLVVQPMKQKLVSPLVVSYFYEKGFIKEFSYTGLMDFTGYITAQDAIHFVKRVCGGYTKMRAYIHTLAKQVVELLTQMWGTICIQKYPENYGAMPIIQLPFFVEEPTAANAAAIMLYLLENDFTTFVFVEEFRGKRMLVIRLACQIFHELSDFEELGRVVMKFDTTQMVSSTYDKALCYLKQV